jgi:hypothetical protein
MWLKGAFMKPVCVTFLLSVAALQVACGSNLPARKIGGIWNANLQNFDSSSAYRFSATLTQNSGSTVDVSAFLFVDSPRCFPSQTGQTATFSSTRHSGGYEIGPFAMHISTTFGTATENVLALDGVRGTDGKISGTWILTGAPGCSGSGTYTMQALTPL